MDAGEAALAAMVGAAAGQVTCHVPVPHAGPEVRGASLATRGAAFCCFAVRAGDINSFLKEASMMQRLADSPQVSEAVTAAGALLQLPGGTGLLQCYHLSLWRPPGWHPLRAALLPCPSLLLASPL